MQISNIVCSNFNNSIYCLFSLFIYEARFAEKAWLRENLILLLAYL